MEFLPLGASGAHMVRLNVQGDARGAFARVWCEEAFAAAGLAFQPVQANWSTTMACGTVRGMHVQRAPFGDSKIVRVSQGRIFDVIYDLRPDSPTFGCSFTAVLDAQGGLALFVPAGFAHGYQALTDAVTVEYLHGEAPFTPSHYDGFRPDDPFAGIEWPEHVINLSERDRSYPPLETRLTSIYAGGTS